MNVKGLTRESVASHLQKYRLYLKRLSGAKLEPHPIASFQASEGGECGGSMRILPGGRSPSSVPSIKGLNHGTGITESNMCVQNLNPGIVKASQHKQQGSANRVQVLDAVGFVDSCPVAAAPRKASFDLLPYLQVPQSHLLSSCSMPSSLGGSAHSGSQPDPQLEDEMGARPYGVQGAGFVSHFLSSCSMPSSLGVFAHSGPQHLELEDGMGATPRGAQVEGFMSYWNINPVGKHDLGQHAAADAQMQGSYGNLQENPASNLTSGDERLACSEGTQEAGRCVEIPNDRNLSGEMCSCTPTTEMNRETNMDAVDLVQIPEQHFSVSDYLLDEEFL